MTSAEQKQTRGGFKEQLSWAVYDLANNAYVAVVLTVFMSLHIINLTGSPKWFGWINSGSMIVAALILPMLGVICDRTGRSKRYLVWMTFACVAATAGLSLAGGLAVLVLALFFVSNLTYQVSLLCYNNLLPGLIGREREGSLSGLGIGLAYIGTITTLLISNMLVPDVPLRADHFIVGNRSMVEKVSDTPGIETLGTIRRTTVKGPGGDVPLTAVDLEPNPTACNEIVFKKPPRTGAVDPKLSPEVKRRRLAEKTWGRFRERDTVLMAEAFADTHSLKLDGRIELETPAGKHAFRIVGIYRQGEGADPGLMMRRRTYDDHWDDDQVNAVLIYSAAEVDMDELTSELERRSGTEVVRRAFEYRWTFLLAAGVFLLFAMPAILFVPERPSVDPRPLDRKALGEEFRNVISLLRNLPSHRALFLFFLGNFLLTDLLNTSIMAFSPYLVEVFDLSTSKAIVTVIIPLNISAFGSGIVMGWLSDKIPAKYPMMAAALLLGSALASAGIWADPSDFWFVQWILIVCGGLGLAGIWAAGRKCLLDLAPPDKIGAYFGLYVLSQKVSVIGSATFFTLASLESPPFGLGSYQFAILAQLVILVPGLILIFSFRYPERTYLAK